VSAAGALLLTRHDVESLLDLDGCIAAVEEAFRAFALGRTRAPGILGFPYPGGGFHIKAAGIDFDRPYFAVKINGNYSDNPIKRGMPAIQGVVALYDAESGRPLALFDSISITAARTAAATAVAAKHLARKNSAVATICGCGTQGRAQLLALRRVVPLELVYAVDSESARAERFAEDLAQASGIEIRPTRDLSMALRASDVIVTCTPSRRAYVGPDDVRPGTFLAAVGADSPDKQELAPALVAASKLVVDLREQCAEIGELHHAIADGRMTVDDVHADLGEVVAGLRPGRESETERIVFDSTGTGLQDAAAAADVYERAIAEGFGRSLDFSSAE
jgi:alanine dehydrogenase